MGCNVSKVEDFPAVALCRERKRFLKAASEQRYALAAAHVAYFHSLREIGDALCQFAEQDLTSNTGSSSPVLTLPSETKSINNHKLSSSSASISHADSPEGSHLPLSSGSELSSPSPSHSHSHSHSHSSSPPHILRSPEPDPPPYGYYQNYQYAHYMKRSVPNGKPMVYEEPERHVATIGQWPDPSYGYGFYAFPGGDYPHYPPPGPSSSPPRPPPAPPSPPRVSTWDFLNVFESFENGYPVYPPRFGSSASSPDSKEVREREGIPDLEDETQHEAPREAPAKEKVNKKVAEEKGFAGARDFGEGPSNSKTVPLQQVSSSDGSSKTVRFHDGSDNGTVEKEIKSSPDTVVSEEHGAKKGVSFEIDEATVTAVDGDSSVLSSLTTLSAHGTRDLREVVVEIKDDFVTASNFGKEVALLLEVCKPPYRSRVAALRVIFSRILQMVAPSRLPSDPPSIQFSSREMKLARTYCGEPGKDFKTNPENLSSTLEKLYAWEKKLYKEVKDEERLRVIYEKQFKRLKTLDNLGAESSKIDATRASIRKLQTKINICIRTAETIMGRIHKLRDNELQPQLAALINGFTRMWKFMLKCHQKQFQAIMESKSQSLKINVGLQGDEVLKAIVELEKELLNWCSQFNIWVKTQKTYVKNLNEWLMRCLPNEPEETSDGIAPFSPSRLHAPPVFIICNDWHQAMTRTSETGVAEAMHEFAQKLHELWERQDEAQRQRIKAEYLRKDFEKQLRTLRTEMGGLEHDNVSGKTALSKLTSDSGVSPLDDLKVDLDSMKKRLHEERVRHKEAVKLVRDAANNSLQAGLIPIFKTLESFTSEVVKAHEQVRLQNASGDS